MHGRRLEQRDDLRLFLETKFLTRRPSHQGGEGEAAFHIDPHHRPLGNQRPDDSGQAVSRAARPFPIPLQHDFLAPDADVDLLRHGARRQGNELRLPHDHSRKAVRNL